MIDNEFILVLFLVMLYCDDEKGFASNVLSDSTQVKLVFY